MKESHETHCKLQRYTSFASKRSISCAASLPRSEPGRPFHFNGVRGDQVRKSERVQPHGQNELCLA